MSDDIVPDIDLCATLSREAWEDAAIKAANLDTESEEVREPTRKQVGETIQT